MGQCDEKTNTSLDKDKKVRTTSDDTGGKSVREKSKSTGGKCVTHRDRGGIGTAHSVTHRDRGGIGTPIIR
jgi:hypothetical protein